MDTVENQSLSLQDNDTRNKIRSLWLNGKNIITIQGILGIANGTWDNAYYLNKYGFRDFITHVKKEKFLQLAESVSGEILNMQTTENAKMLAIKQKEAEFIRETLLKDHGYSKRIETIGLNINKNEPLDDDQKAKLDKLIKKSGIIADMQNTDVVENGLTEPL